MNLVLIKVRHDFEYNQCHSMLYHYSQLVLEQSEDNRACRSIKLMPSFLVIEKNKRIRYRPQTIHRNVGYNKGASGVDLLNYMNIDFKLRNRRQNAMNTHTFCTYTYMTS